MKTKHLLAALMLSMSLSLFAQSGTCGDNLTWTLDTESGILTISGTGAMTDYYRGGPWYSYSESIKTVKIGSSVTSIGVQAFIGCSGLTSVTIPNSVTYIGELAFYGCGNLTAVHISDIAAWCRIAFGDSDANPLSYAHNLYLNGTLVTDLVIPDGVTTIRDLAFYGCSSLTSITIPNSLTYIGGSAFAGCSSLTSVTIPNSVTSIGGGAFFGCSSLTSVTIPNSVTSIGGSAFYNCTGLTSITIPNSVTSIEWSAFYNCSSLASVTIGESVTSIGNCAFKGCSKLATVIWNAKKCNDFSSDTPFYYYYDSSSSDNFDVSKQITSFTFGDNVEYIPAYLCSRMSNLTSVTIPNSVTSIGESAFQDCSSLTSVTIPNSVTYIGWCAFSHCTGLTSITIPNSVTDIGNNAFQDCSSLTSITIPNGVTSIGVYAFSNCTGLTSVHISDLAAWCKISFYSSSSNPLYYAHNLYLNGTLVTDLVIPNSVTSIGEYAFDGCSSLTSITIPNSVTSIGGYAFQDCSSLTSVTIPNSVTTIGDYAFEDCSSLTSITCEAVNPPTLGDDVFEGVNKSIPLYVPSDNLYTVLQYKLTIGWKDFTNILPISSQTGDVTTPTVTVTTTSADIAWPQISGAASYELVIKDKSGNVVCTLVFDAEGHLTSLNFGAPDRDNIRKQPQAGTFSFTVTGLKENTEYTYTLTAKDSQGKAIDTKTGTFKTIGGTPVDETERDAAPAPRKQMKNGILYILTPDGTAYDLQGQRID